MILTSDNLHSFMHEIKAQLEEIKGLIKQGLKNVDLAAKKKELEDLTKEMGTTNFWENNEHAQEVTTRAAHLSKTVKTWDKIKGECDELIEMMPEISPEKDEKGYKEFKGMVSSLVANWRKLEIQTFLSGKYDANNAIVSVHSGTGGTDAQDFAEMLMRMYLRYAERMEFEAQIMDKSDGEEAGIKSTTFIIKGQFAYGYLKGEAGVHRLVRLSPFNSGSTRETSFALVEVIPETSAGEVEINPDDIRVDVYRSGGHGGQGVNKTDSAVRMTHIPTGIVVQCQNERSQQQNRIQALKILHARLAAIMEKEKAKELRDLKGKHVEMSWGNQIRSYVLHPYKMVKDHRTGYEESQPDKVLDGDIDGFIEAELKKIKE